MSSTCNILFWNSRVLASCLLACKCVNLYFWTVRKSSKQRERLAVMLDTNQHNNKPLQSPITVSCQVQLWDPNNDWIPTNRRMPKNKIKKAYLFFIFIFLPTIYPSESLLTMLVLSLQCLNLHVGHLKTTATLFFSITFLLKAHWSPWNVKCLTFTSQIPKPLFCWLNSQYYVLYKYQLWVSKYTLTWMVAVCSSQFVFLSRT